jgi:hypothetical protein
MGRRRVKEKGLRIIDIDILLFGKSIVNAKGLNIPHAAMHPGVSYWSRLRKSLQVSGTQCLSGRYASCLSITGGTDGETRGQIVDCGF